MADLTMWEVLIRDNLFRDDGDEAIGYTDLEVDFDARSGVIFIGIDDYNGRMGAFMTPDEAITALQEAIDWIKEKSK